MGCRRFVAPTAIARCRSDRRYTERGSRGRSVRSESGARFGRDRLGHRQRRGSRNRRGRAYGGARSRGFDAGGPSGASLQAVPRQPRSAICSRSRSRRSAGLGKSGCASFSRRISSTQSPHCRACGGHCCSPSTGQKRCFIHRSPRALPLAVAPYSPQCSLGPARGRDPRASPPWGGDSLLRRGAGDGGSRRYGRSAFVVFCWERSCEGRWGRFCACKDKARKDEARTDEAWTDKGCGSAGGLVARYAHRSCAELDEVAAFAERRGQGGSTVHRSPPSARGRAGGPDRLESGSGTRRAPRAAHRRSSA